MEADHPQHNWNMPHDVRAIEAQTVGCPPNCPYAVWAREQDALMAAAPAKPVAGTELFRVTMKYGRRPIRIANRRQLAALKGAHGIHNGVSRVERVIVTEWEDVTSQHT
jgi:hypothetical protein